MQDKDKHQDIIHTIENALELEKSPGKMSLDHLDMLADALGGVPCWGALPGSPSAQAGIRYGDIVLEINGKPTPDYDTYFAARHLRQDGCTFKVWRDGGEVTGEMLFRS